MTSGEVSVIQSLATHEAHRIKAGSHFTKQEWATALGNVGATLVPPMTGAQVQRLLVQSMNASKEKRTSGAAANQNGSGKARRKKHARGAQDLYARWVADHDEVPNDRTLSFFTSFSDSAFSQARASLKAKGYDFDMPHNGHGHVKVTARPVVPPPAPTPTAKAEPVKPKPSAEDVARVTKAVMEMLGMA